MLARESAENSAKLSKDQMEADAERLAAAEKQMRTMLDKVNEETKAVEDAMIALKAAQAELENDSSGQMSALKAGGLVKQGALVGTLLFAVRSLADFVSVLGGDSSYLMPAVIQAALAVTFLVAFLFVK